MVSRAAGWDESEKVGEVLRLRLWMEESHWNANAQELVSEPLKEAENVDPFVDRNSNVNNLVADPLNLADTNCQIVEDVEIKEGDEVAVSHNSNLVMEPFEDNISNFEINQSQALIAEVGMNFAGSVLVNAPIYNDDVPVDQQNNARISEVENSIFEIPHIQEGEGDEYVVIARMESSKFDGHE
ncbi:hypothetical protein MA16_Dca018393 [Dendrobium catenatum]|uniref:Uncharacterized protein n=1 Tax=Dendrobium catenatum TaxID=906689 RepID=A0A2I0VVJ5_9ASPA|nr:hypothetical protein MA16_Dca018393 [Dendrobium catenatum]